MVSEEVIDARAMKLLLNKPKMKLSLMLSDAHLPCKR